MFTKQTTKICKGIAILMMLFHHLFNDYGEYAGYTINYWPLNGDRTTLLACLCGGCVTIFVFLSGYGLAASYDSRFHHNMPDKTELTAFIGKRCWNLLERYWFIFFLALLASPFGRTPLQAYGSDLKSGLFYFAVDALGLAYMFGTPTLNPTWWYIAMALYIIILMPFLMRAVKRCGSVSVLAAMMAIMGIMGLQTDAARYLFGLMLGVICWEYRLYDRLCSYCSKSILHRILVNLLILFLMAGIVRYRLDYRYFGIVDGVFSMLLCWFCGLGLGVLPLVREILEYLGEHSANIFLTHNLLYSFYFTGFYYQFRYPVVILAVLTITSLLLSIVIEKLMAWTGYHRIMKRVCPVR